MGRRSSATSWTAHSSRELPIISQSYLGTIATQQPEGCFRRLVVQRLPPSQTKWFTPAIGHRATRLSVRSAQPERSTLTLATASHEIDLSRTFCFRSRSRFG